MKIVDTLVVVLWQKQKIVGRFATTTASASATLIVAKIG